MIDLEKQKERFKNHIATFTDYGNIKILDFKKPNSSEYRIRFLFEEDYYKLHITGDLGDLISSNYYNMTFEKFARDYVDNTGYFEEKIDCHSRDIYYYDFDLAIDQLREYIEENCLEDDIADYYYPHGYDDEVVENLVIEFVDEVMEHFTDTYGIGVSGYDVLSKVDEDCFYNCSDIGKQPTGILDLYMLAFKLAMEQLESRGTIK